jgi:hypothetical protein
VQQIADYANSNGLSHAQLEQLLKSLTVNKTHLDAAKIRVLVRCLVPQSKIRQSTIVQVINSLGEGHGKAAYSIQVSLV